MTNSFSVSVSSASSTSNNRPISQKCIKLKGALKSPDELLPKIGARCLVMSSKQHKQQLDVQPSSASLTNDGYKRITNPQCVDSCGSSRRGASSSNSSSAAKGFTSQNHDIPHQLCMFSPSESSETVASDKHCIFSVRSSSGTNLLPGGRPVPFSFSSTSGSSGGNCTNNIGHNWDDQISPNYLCSFESVVFKVPNVPSDHESTSNITDNLPDNNPHVYLPFTSEQDYSSLKSVLHRLYISGFYYEGLSSKEATELLEGKSNGSFLLRDSSDPNHLFSLSLKTPRGTTSVRIEYHKGKFRLDSEDCLKNRMPTFDCVISLIMYYVKRVQGKSGRRVLLDSTGRRDLPVKLTQPVLKVVPMMKHSSRKAICRTLNNPSMDIEQLPLPNLLKSYLSQYPYPL